MVDQSNFVPVRPNWAETVSQDISFRTEVLVSRDGTEQRIAQRIKPRVEFDYAGLAYGPGIRRFMARASKGQGGQFWFSYPLGADRITQRVQPGQSVIYVANSAPLSNADRLALFHPRTHYAELLDLTGAGAGGDNLVLADPVGADFPAGSLLFRAVKGHFLEAAEASFRTDSTATLGMNWRMDVVGAYHPNYPTTPPDTMDGNEFLDLRHNWNGTLDISTEQQRIAIDFNRGPVDYYFPVSFTTRVSRPRLVLRNSAEIEAVVGAFYRARGAQRAFRFVWPIQEVGASTAISDGQFSAPGTDLADAHSDLSIYKWVRIVRNTGGPLKRTIQSISADGFGNTQVALTDGTLDVDFSDIKAIYLVSDARFATDRLALEWETETVCTASPTIMSLEAQ